ncbi:MAG: hypothetical protein K2X82_06615 [Gemmataceae bacterium]|nr:hypothetical protein [Gemmataceae bacterium]
MATFYLLPPRACLDDAVSGLLARLLPGLPPPAEPWEAVAGRLADEMPDIYLVPADDLPADEPPADALAAGWGAEPGDRVVEVRLAGAAREWAVPAAAGAIG